jgi:tripartite ATP-independent transporter DctM subunit
MSGLGLAGLIFALMLVLMAVRIPIAVSMFAAGSVGYLVQAGWLPYSNFLNNQAYARFTSYDLSVIPLFLLMGQFATQGGLSKALFQFAHGLLARFKGGMAMASVLACAIFGAVCGSSIATAATVTSVALPEMKRHGYNGGFSTATLAAGGTLGIMIPPSVILVIYGILTEQNIAKLFAAAMIPGLIATLGYLIAIFVYVRWKKGVVPERDPEAHTNLKEGLIGLGPIFAIFMVVFGGIYGGLFTPTEGAAVGAACTFIAAVIKREMTWDGFLKCFYVTAENSAMIFLLFLGADLMNSALALTQVPNQLAEAVKSMGLAPVAVVGFILLFYIVLGSVMDELSMILLTIPIFFPLVMGLDFGMPAQDKAIWFGVLILCVVQIGLIAPPVGLNVYVVNGMAKTVPIAESYRNVMPFLVSDVVRTVLLLLFPAIALWPVRFVG